VVAIFLSTPSQALPFPRPMGVSGFLESASTVCDGAMARWGSY
jgi:hypothetical protein